MTDKAADAFRTISEVAGDLDIPQHVLRFWESRFAVIRPLKRAGGRRYYRPDDVALLRGIRVLLYGQGYTIKGVQRILREQGPRMVQAIGLGELAPAAIPRAPPEDTEAEEAPAPARQAPPATEAAPSQARLQPLSAADDSDAEEALDPRLRHGLERLLHELAECRRIAEQARCS